jgi:cell division protein FtsW
MREKKIDKLFLIIFVTLLIVGVAMFISASLGLLAKNEKMFYSVLFNQLVLGLGLGLVGMYVFFKIDYKFLRKYAFLIFLGSILLTACVFIPHLGWSHGGARRWLKIGPVSFQPVEILKFSFVIYFAAWLSGIKERVGTLNWGLLPFLGFSAILGAILLAQPDTDTFAVTIFAGLSMYIIAGAKWRHVLSTLFLGLTVLAVLYFARPYIKQRIDVLIHPVANSQTTSYNSINLSLPSVQAEFGAGDSAKAFRNFIICRNQWAIRSLRWRRKNSVLSELS